MNITVAESIGLKKRTSSAVLYALPFPLGTMLFACIAYFVRHWQALQAATSLPMILLVGFFW